MSLNKTNLQVAEINSLGIVASLNVQVIQYENHKFDCSALLAWTRIFKSIQLSYASSE